VGVFLGFKLTTEVIREIVAATVPLRECAPELAWVDEERLHLTLKFLGEQPAERVEEVQASLARVAGRHREPLLAIGGVGAFPNFRRARVVWLGVDQDPRLELLHHDAEVEFERLGFEIEGRAFRPHLTLARVRQPLAEDRVRLLRRAAKQIEYRSDFIVRSIDLMQSDLAAGGSRYRILASAALRSD
jgi:2'-5' RNA ligase